MIKQISVWYKYPVMYYYSKAICHLLICKVVVSRHIAKFQSPEVPKAHHVIQPYDFQYLSQQIGYRSWVE